MTILQALHEAKKRLNTRKEPQTIYVVYNFNNMSLDWRKRYEARESDMVRGDSFGKSTKFSVSKNAQHTISVKRLTAEDAKIYG